jgi:hypothetical protein
MTGISKSQRKERESESEREYENGSFENRFENQ